MENRRTVQRTRLLKNALIVYGEQFINMHCTLLDLSRDGACLSLASTYKVPDSFKLTFDHGRSHRLCQVVWRSQQKLGVTFGQPPALANQTEQPADVKAAS